MIALNQLLYKSGTVSRYMDENRFQEETDSSLLRYVKKDLSVLFWNLTLKCNLNCQHCYANASAKPDPGELSDGQISDLIRDLKNMGLPVVIFSGGEPFLRTGFYDFIRQAKESKIRVSISTNGTLITETVASELKDLNVDYAGISIDGMNDIHDQFRGMKNSFNRAVMALNHLKNNNVMTGIRFTVTGYNYKDLKKVVELGMEIGVDRFCLYHLVPSGRGAKSIDISKKERKKVLDYLMETTYNIHDQHIDMEVLTVDNPSDGLYLLLKVMKEDDKLAKQIYRLLMKRGGDGSGIKAGNIDPVGNVHPNQFWWDLNMGNVKEKRFSDIWKSSTDPVIKEIRENSSKKLSGKCGRCNFKEVCGGFRLRALRVNGDLWSEDPDCLLSEKEIKTEIPEGWI
ncbi:MAG: radical SAM protein [Candidatus Thermoplasmatota archaeon]|nr:radical SAM protein [Candidatus Thermoplasmatota archaeon]MCL5963836.1 radical SAM protein [Candidatus Thermoplasmatota archaeon]